MLPYSVFISSQTGQPLIIENIGSWGLTRPGVEPALAVGGLGAPNFLQLARFFTSRFIHEPVTFVSDIIRLSLAMFQLGGGRWLATRRSSHRRRGTLRQDRCARPWRSCAAGPGRCGSSRRRRRATARYRGPARAVDRDRPIFTALSGYSGQRFREPFDWALLTLASCVIAAQWRRPQLLVALICMLVSLSCGWAALKTARASLAARADYGIGSWDYDQHTRTTTARGSAGFAVFPFNDTIDLLIRSRSGDSKTFQLRVDGIPLQAGSAGPGEQRLRVSYPRLRAFVQIDPRPPATSLSDLEIFDYSARKGR